VLRVGKWNHVPSFLQVKTLQCRTSLVYQFSSSKRVISYYTPGYSEYIEDICWFRWKIEFYFTSGQHKLIFSRVA